MTNYVSSALRSYTPNAFAGGNPAKVTSMAPHLSVAAGDRPFASDISMLQGAGFGGQMPDLDKMWRYSPTTYQSQVADLLRQPNAASKLVELKNPPPQYGATKEVIDDEGRTVLLTYQPDRDDGEDRWVRTRPQRSGDD